MPPTYATLTLTKAWLQDADNPADALLVGTARTSAPGVNQAGFIRELANGRRQGVTQSATLARTTPLLLRTINQPALTWLYAHLSKTILFRSRVGERMYCVYYGFEPRPIDHVSTGAGYGSVGGVRGVAFDVTLELNEVDYDEVIASG